MLQILIADDHDIVRRGVRGIIEAHPDWTVCCEAANGDAVLELARLHRPDIAILDLQSKGGEHGSRSADQLTETGISAPSAFST